MTGVAIGCMTSNRYRDVRCRGCMLAFFLICLLGLDFCVSKTELFALSPL
jgi:hypothetical protein